MFKTLSFAVMHFAIAFSVAWALTGDLWVGGLVALVEPTINSVAYFFHERLWQRAGARRALATRQAPQWRTLGA